MSKRKSVSLFLLAALAGSMPAQAATLPSQYAVLGAGIKSCDVWLSARKSHQVIAFMIGSWVEGFLTAYNETEDGDLTEGTDIDGLENWLDEYCALHPLDDMEVAASALVSELRARRTKAP